MTDLDLTVDVFPCPKNATRNREVVQQLGGKQQFPFMVDENNGKQLYESDEIVKYLYQTYGDSAGNPRALYNLRTGECIRSTFGVVGEYDVYGMDADGVENRSRHESV